MPVYKSGRKKSFGDLKVWNNLVVGNKIVLMLFLDEIREISSVTLLCL